MNIQIKNAKWTIANSHPSEFVIEIPKDTPKWGILQAMQNAFEKKFDDVPYTYTMSFI